MSIRLASTILAACLGLGATGIAPAQEKATGETAKSKPDNTRVNKRDRNKGEPTADQAKNAPADRELMQKIRKAVVGDKSLSSYAHNVKIIAQGGKVTLKGPVRSEEEKKAVEDKATEVAGAGNVTNEITVKPAAAKRSAKTS